MSALYGTPPNTEKDYWVAKALLTQAGKVKADASLGAILPPFRPEDYVYHSRGPALKGLLASMISIVIIITGARLMMRRLSARMKFGADDWMIIPAAVFVIAWLADVIAMVNYGCAGKHKFDCTYEELYVHTALSVVGTPIFFTAVSLTKMSITLFNRRLTGLSSRRWMIVHYVFLTALALHLVITVLLLILAQIPVRAMYDIVWSAKNPGPRKKINVVRIILVLTIINTIFDWLLLAVPILVVWKIQLSKWRKAGLFLIFLVGGLACISSVMRLAARKESYTVDNTYNTFSFILWTVLDLFFSIIVASLPALSGIFPLICGRLRKLFATGRSNGSYSNHSGYSDGDTLERKPSLLMMTDDGITRKDEVQLEFGNLEDYDSNHALTHHQHAPWSAVNTTHPEANRHQVNVSAAGQTPQQLETV
ncbi:MAG: hypothetical protein M1837_002498 [Sclerophora amabilis]|nr:MAG: hypothetical protein M1837_002498 [Sclerophora amabilis]